MDKKQDPYAERIDKMNKLFLILLLSFSLGAAVTVTSQSTAFGGIAGGTPVTVDGSGFDADQGAGYVQFGGFSATIVSWSDIEIQCLSPAHVPGPVNLKVHNNEGSNGYGPDGFTYLQSPPNPSYRINPWNFKRLQAVADTPDMSGGACQGVTVITGLPDGILLYGDAYQGELRGIATATQTQTNIVLEFYGNDSNKIVYLPVTIDLLRRKNHQWCARRRA